MRTPQSANRGESSRRPRAALLLAASALLLTSCGGGGGSGGTEVAVQSPPPPPVATSAEIVYGGAGDSYPVAEAGEPYADYVLDLGTTLTLDVVTEPADGTFSAKLVEGDCDLTVSGTSLSVRATGSATDCTVETSAGADGNGAVLDSIVIHAEPATEKTYGYNAFSRIDWTYQTPDDTTPVPDGLCGDTEPNHIATFPSPRRGTTDQIIYSSDIIAYYEQPIADGGSDLICVAKIFSFSTSEPETRREFYVSFAGTEIDAARENASRIGSITGLLGYAERKVGRIGEDRGRLFGVPEFWVGIRTIGFGFTGGDVDTRRGFTPIQFSGPYSDMTNGIDIADAYITEGDFDFFLAFGNQGGTSRYRIVIENLPSGRAEIRLIEPLPDP